MNYLLNIRAGYGGYNSALLFISLGVRSLGWGVRRKEEMSYPPLIGTNINNSSPFFNLVSNPSSTDNGLSFTKILT